MRNLKRGFTLAEVMIVLTVIGVLTAILLPVARQSMPDENLMKFKKAHNTLGAVIRELVTSDEYYRDGNLAIMSNGNYVDDVKYFCKTIADVINAKEVNCLDIDTNVSNVDEKMIEDNSLESFEWYLDYACMVTASRLGSGEIILPDNVTFYQSGPSYTFSYLNPFAEGERLYERKENGFYNIYKIFCVDIDGIPNNITENDCINECPFGYAIRVDGKIRSGKKAIEWLERDVNEE